MKKETLKKRLYYISTHRGTKEADLLLGGFVHTQLEKMNLLELKQLEHILSYSDILLMSWIEEKKNLPKEMATPIMHRLIAFSTEKTGISQYLQIES